MSNMIPCTNPKTCGVKSHYPDTQPLCKAGGSTSKSGTSISATPPVSSSVAEKSSQYMEVTVPAMMLDTEIERCAEGIVNGYEGEEDREEFEDALMARIERLGATTDAECWDAYHAIIANKEMPPRAKSDTSAFDNEHITHSELHGHPGLRIDAGERGGYLVTYETEGEQQGHLILMPDEHVEYSDEHFETNGHEVHKNSDGELWIASTEISGHEFGAPILLSDLKEGSRHWVQDDDESQGKDAEYSAYELARRLYSNPVTRKHIEGHAATVDPGIDERYQNKWSSPYFLPPHANGDRARLKRKK